MDNLERRAFAECRAEASDNGRKIRGYAIRFGSLSENLGGFREIIARKPWIAPSAKGWTSALWWITIPAK